MKVITKNIGNVKQLWKDILFSASDDQVHDKDSFSSTDDDMRFVDVSMYSSDSENLPATTRTKRKLENEGSKGKKHSKTDIKLRIRTRRITEKEKFKYDILMLKKQLHRSKISKKKLKENLRPVESLKMAAQNIFQGMEDMNPLAKMLFKNELFNGVKKPKSMTYTEDIKNFAFKLSCYSNSAYNFLL